MIIMGKEYNCSTEVFQLTWSFTKNPLLEFFRWSGGDEDAVQASRDRTTQTVREGYLVTQWLSQGINMHNADLQVFDGNII